MIQNYLWIDKKQNLIENIRSGMKLIERSSRQLKSSQRIIGPELKKKLENEYPTFSLNEAYDRYMADILLQCLDRE